MTSMHIHQPHFLPSVQYVARMTQVDRFVFADDVQHKRYWWENRNRILLDGRPHRFTLPLVHDSNFDSINAKRIHEPERSIATIVELLRQAYRRCVGWPLLADLCEQMITAAPHWGNLADASIEVTTMITRQLGFDVPHLRWSEHPTLARAAFRPDHEAPEGVAPKDWWRSERIAATCALAACDEFLYGSGTATYLCRASFDRRGITLTPDAWQPDQYDQGIEGFVPNLCIVDLIASRGELAAQSIGNVRA